jgi:hypothetical protein
MPPRPFLITLAVALLVAMLPLPYGYYQLLRLVTCGLGAWCALAAWQDSRQLIAGSWGLLALLYNPLMPIHLDRETWTIINLASAAGVVAFVWRGLRS